MLIDSSSYKNMKMLNLIELVEDLETVKQVAEEMGTSTCKVYEVTKKELDNLLEYLKLIAKQTDRIISIELEKSRELSITHTFNPNGLKGKISLHYGELYLIARGIEHPDTILCDDESVFYLNDLLIGICGIKLEIVRTIDLLYSMYLSKKISATEFTRHFEKMIDLGLLSIRLPPKSIKDKSVAKVLLKFIYHLSEIKSEYRK